MNIPSFIAGFLLASALFAGVGVIASDKPHIVGDTGTLVGVEVLNDAGDAVCTDPWYVEGTNTVSCE